MTGYGPESFGREFRRRQSAELSRAYPEHFQESPHNLILDGTLAQGVFYLVFLGGLGALTFGGGFKRTPGPEAGLRASAVATTASLLLITVTISGGLMLIGTVALLIGASTPLPAEPDRLGGRAARPLGALLAVLLAGLALAYLRKDAAYGSVTDDVYAGRRSEMAVNYRYAAAILFPAAGEDLWCSRLFATVARAAGGPASDEAWTLAAEAAARSEGTADNQAEAAFQFALVAIGTNHGAQGEFELRRAIAYARTWYKPHMMLAQYLHFVGRQVEAQAEARLALDLAGTMRKQAEQTLLQVGLP
jgi:hypothetical protein